MIALYSIDIRSTTSTSLWWLCVFIGRDRRSWLEDKSFYLITALTEVWHQFSMSHMLSRPMGGFIEGGPFVLNTRKRKSS
jgi:hypothetical protein